MVTKFQLLKVLQLKKDLSILKVLLKTYLEPLIREFKFFDQFMLSDYISPWQIQELDGVRAQVQRKGFCDQEKW